MTRSLQDGMLKYWLSQRKFADANIEARLEKEPFNLGDMMSKSKPLYLRGNASRSAERRAPERQPGAEDDIEWRQIEGRQEVINFKDFAFFLMGVCLFVGLLYWSSGHTFTTGD
jgi:hypothetical protein